MNLNLFDDIDGLVLRERENSLAAENNTSRRHDDDFDGTSEFPKHTPLAMAYVPFQQWGETKSAEDALDCGTLFCDLVFPFERGGSGK